MPCPSDVCVCVLCVCVFVHVCVHLTHLTECCDRCSVPVITYLLCHQMINHTAQLHIDCKSFTIYFINLSRMVLLCHLPFRCYWPDHTVTSNLQQKHDRKKGCYLKYLCYLAISLNDQLHITPKAAAINQRFVVLSYLTFVNPPMWNVCALFQPNGSSH